MNRPRTHVLETESRKAFEQLLPNTWVFRTFNPDYGIDYQIEIFSDQKSEGKAFYVQLKGTDAEVNNNTISLDLELKYYEYFASLPLPILLVVHSSISKQFWAVWANKYLSGKIVKKKQKYLRINFSAKDMINTAFFVKLEHQFSLYIHEDRGLFIKTDGNADSEQFAIVTRKWLELLFPERLKYEQGNLPLTITIDIASDCKFVSCSISDSELGRYKTRCSIKIADRDFLDFPVYNPNSLPPQLYEFIFVFAVVLLDISPEKAMDIIKNVFANYEGKYKKIETIVHIAHTYLTSRRFSDFTTIVDDCINRSKWNDFQLLSMSTLFQLEKSKRDIDLIRDLYQHNLRKAILITSGNLKGIFCYNYANSIRSNFSVSESLHWYLEAKRNKPDYLKMDYWWKEVAGMLFIGKRYTCSANCYKHSCTLGDRYKPLIFALTADALFMSRSFNESVEWFEKYFKSEVNPDSEWFLKHKSARFLISNGLPKKSIQRKQAEQIAISAINDKSFDDKKKTDLLCSAIELDPLCSIAWFNYAVILSKIGEQQTIAMAGFLICALTNTGDKESWINALFLAFNEKNDVIFLHIANTILQKFGRSILGDIAQFIKEQPVFSVKKKKGFYERISYLFNQIGKQGGIISKSSAD
jgi:hypothetical protein